MPRRRRRKPIKYTNVKKVKVKKTSKKYTEYISPNKYIAAFYTKNKTFIDNNIDAEWLAHIGDSKTAFKKLIEDKMKYDNPSKGRKYNVNEAIKAVMGSKEMNPTWTAKDVYANNFIQKIRSDKDLKTAIMNEMDEEKLLKYSYIRQPKKKKENEVVDDLAESLEQQAKTEGKQIDVVRIREGFQKEKVNFEGYYEVNKTNAVVYTYDKDIYIIEYKSPAKGSGATFQFMSKWEFEDREASGYIKFMKYRKNKN